MTQVTSFCKGDTGSVRHLLQDPVLNYVENQYEAFLEAETKVVRNPQMADSRSCSPDPCSPLLPLIPAPPTSLTGLQKI